MNSRLVYASISYWLIFLILLAGALISKSSSVLSESMHQLFDAVSVSFAFLSSAMAMKPASERLTYGYHRLENISVIVNAIALIGGAILSFYVATERLVGGSRIEIGSALPLSVIALPLLILATLVLNRKSHDIAENSVVFHAIADSVTLVIVIATLAVLHFYKIVLIDSISAYLITAVFIATSFPILKSGLKILLDVAPDNILEIENDLKQISSGVHHVHVWAICSHIKIATIHVSESGEISLTDLEKERKALEEIMAKYGINHTTIQFESNGRA